MLLSLLVRVDRIVGLFSGECGYRLANRRIVEEKKNLERGVDPPKRKIGKTN